VNGSRFAALLAAFALLTQASDGRATAPLLPRGKAISVYVSLQPRVVLFGDALRLRVTVLVDGAKIDPGSVRLHALARPWMTLHLRRKQRDIGGGIEQVLFALELGCLKNECVPTKKQYAFFHFSEASVSYQTLSSRKDGVVRFRLGTVEVLSRINVAAFVDVLQRSAYSPTPYVYHLTPLPAVSYRASPVALASSALAAAAGFAAVAVLLGFRYWRKRRPSSADGVPVAFVHPIDRVLDVLRDARERNDELVMRKALERLAVELDGDERGKELAIEAHELAWAAPRPDQVAVAAFETRVQKVTAR